MRLLLLHSTVLLGDEISSLLLKEQFSENIEDEIFVNALKEE